MEREFTRKKCRTNLLKHQRCTLQHFQTDRTHIIFPSDKNLGPCIVERTTYINRVLHDHLLDPNTYQRLTEPEAADHIESIKYQVRTFLFTHHAAIKKTHHEFLRQSLKTKDPYSYFYVTAKVHKNPWKTRPIVSTCGSILDGLAKWVDAQLQPIVQALPSYIESSADLLDLFKALPQLPDSAKLVTADAVSMYTNIDTAHALTVLPTMIPMNRIHGKAILKALEIIMRNNIFKFADTYWKQLTGTAMGTPPAPPYATLYYGSREKYLLQKYQPWIIFYKRYIDDVLMLWDFNNNLSHTKFREFSNEMAYGRLQWEIHHPSNRVDFLDITITLQNGHIFTNLFEKALNLYLYLPPHSSHPLEYSVV